MFPTLQIGPLALQTPGLLLLIGVYLGLSLTERYALRRNMKADPLYGLFFLVAAFGLIGARLSFAVQNITLFRSTPLALISLDPYLLDPWGGFAAGFLAGWLYGKRKKITFLPTLDAYTPALAVFAVALGLAHLASGHAFGVPTSLPWGMELWGARRHPSQVYEVIAASAILFIVWRQSRKNLPAGTIFLQFVALSAGARLFLEAFRGDSVLALGTIRVAQAIAWLIMACALILLEIRKERSDPKSITPKQMNG
jgi:phosphatidylglycerol---prolipoprotein diacylglyceryl transferase